VDVERIELLHLPVDHDSAWGLAGVVLLGLEHFGLDVGDVAAPAGVGALGEGVVYAVGGEGFEQHLAGVRGEAVGVEGGPPDDVDRGAQVGRVADQVGFFLPDQLGLDAFRLLYRTCFWF